MERLTQLSLIFLLAIGLAACKNRRNGGSDKEKDSDKDVVEVPAGEQSERLIFHTGTCFGACPDYAMSVSTDGKVELWGGLFAKWSGYYAGELEEADRKTVVELMADAGWDSLKTNYQAGWTDDRTVSVAVVRGGRIVQSIRDYGGIANEPAQSVYNLMNRLYQDLELKPMGPEALTCWPFHESSFTVQGTTYRLMRSEQFFLWQEWMHHGEVTGSFIEPWEEATEPHYLHNPGRFPGKKAPRMPNCVQNSPKALDPIVTDGTSFTIRYDSGDQIQIALDYHFFKENAFVYAP